MAAEKDFELLDEYLANRMPAEERAAFEKKIESEPELQKEIRLQQTLIESLKKARIAELKGMLNNVAVPAATATSAAVKIAAGIAITAAIGIGVYFSFSKTETVATPSIVHPEENPTPTPEAPTPEKEQPAIVEQEEEPKRTAATTKKTKKQKPEPAAVPVIEPKIDVFDPTGDLTDESNEPTEGDILSDDDRISTEDATIFVAVDSTNRRHHFHYTLKKDNLLLFGSFEEHLYEILEFFSQDKRTAFLYYKKAYYYLKETEKITALLPVQDPALLNKLRQHRTKN
jgi:hypothetical protein